ncbi:hypothetical protein PC119_g28281 [Phytophthora cactorum]|uniref:Secreted protein n=1 Tax=Phytophthora cactorum TaxID=29920 RepID=A0A8T1A7J0_9STRA|nr:hypothetical protein PC117_g28361 [Phytophthora cactorum]KAG2950315.1 hypothetical protein PC119_g28281 [Phytophthora cactorum]
MRLLRLLLPLRAPLLTFMSRLLQPLVRSCAQLPTCRRPALAAESARRLATPSHAVMAIWQRMCQVISVNDVWAILPEGNLKLP